MVTLGMGTTAALLASAAGFVGAALAGRRLAAARIPDLLVVTAAGSMAGLLSQAAPTGTAWIDGLERAGLATVLALAARRLPREVLLLTALGCGALAFGSIGGIAAFTAAGSLVLRGPERPPWMNGIAGAGIASAALNFHERLGPMRWGLAAALVVAICGLGYRRLQEHDRRIARRTALGGVAAVVLTGASAAVALLGAYSTARSTQASLEAAARGLGNGDDTVSRGSLDRAELDLRDLRDAINSPLAVPASAVPIAAQHLRVGRRTLASGVALVESIQTVAAAGKTEDLVPRQGQVDLSHLSRMKEPLAGLQSAALRTRTDIRASRSPYLLPPANEALDAVDDQLRTAVDGIEKVRVGLDAVPGLLGADEPRHIFVGFTTPSEVRGSQGILGSYAELEAVDGKLRLLTVGRDTDLNRRGVDLDKRVLRSTQGFIDTYGRFSPQRVWQNVTMSPDFPAVGKAIAEVYPQSGGAPIDTVVLLDPEGVAALLGVTGPVTVPQWPVPITSANAVQVLGIEQYGGFPTNEARVEFLAALTRAAFEKLLTLEPRGLRSAASCLGNAASGRHILAWSPNPEEELLFQLLGADGTLPERQRGRVVGPVVLNNGAGNKVDWFMEHEESVAITRGPDLKRLVTVTVKLTNNAPTTGYPDYVLLTFPQKDKATAGFNTTLVSVYTAGKEAAFRVDGVPAMPAVPRTSDRGYEVHTISVNVPPGQSRTMTLTVPADLDPLDPADLIRPSSLDHTGCD